MNTAFTAIPAIDVRNERVVRLVQGDYARETVYDHSPLAVAQRYQQAGAQWLHLVDLDAARLGAYSLQKLLSSLRDSTSLKIQTGGGIRSSYDVESLLALGVQRVVVGTMAVREPGRVAGWIRDYGSERITLALDARRDQAGIWQLPVAGWTRASAQTLGGVLQAYADAGLVHVLCTDIDRDGMLGGFNLELYRDLAQAWPRLQIQASGGVRSIEDIVAARAAGASAAILGRGLLEGCFSLEEALAC
jgi:phosphoribosylformimino-5-aminoimidazole carboxamide ribotide isomerase